MLLGCGTMELVQLTATFVGYLTVGKRTGTQTRN